MMDGILDEKIVCFFYLLMRDKVVPGEVAAMVCELEETTNPVFKYTNKHLEKYARELVGRLS